MWSACVRRERDDPGGRCLPGVRPAAGPLSARQLPGRHAGRHRRRRRRRTHCHRQMYVDSTPTALTHARAYLLTYLPTYFLRQTVTHRVTVNT